jgi:hypothetical protein
MRPGALLFVFVLASPLAVACGKKSGGPSPAASAAESPSDQTTQSGACPLGMRLQHRQCVWFSGMAAASVEHGPPPDRPASCKCSITETSSGWCDCGTGSARHQVPITCMNYRDGDSNCLQACPPCAVACAKDQDPGPSCNGWH